MRRRAILAVCATLVVSLLLPGPGGGASAATTFRFFGSGYGHGLGMSQWGAYGLAKMGWRDGADPGALLPRRVGPSEPSDAAEDPG